ncbi:hypothetical protein BHE74_00044431 [Ensete ventricosum]|nr:hypothetical protein BHE74_00044431 [Ensete ventricosum]
MRYSAVIDSWALLFNWGQGGGQGIDFQIRDVRARCIHSHRHHDRGKVMVFTSRRRPRKEPRRRHGTLRSAPGNAPTFPFVTCVVVRTVMPRPRVAVHPSQGGPLAARREAGFPAVCGAPRSYSRKALYI